MATGALLLACALLGVGKEFVLWGLCIDRSPEGSFYCALTWGWRVADGIKLGWTIGETKHDVGRHHIGLRDVEPGVTHSNTYACAISPPTQLAAAHRLGERSGIKESRGRIRLIKHRGWCIDMHPAAAGRVPRDRRPQLTQREPRLDGGAGRINSPSETFAWLKSPLCTRRSRPLLVASTTNGESNRLVIQTHSRLQELTKPR
ncbi:hypothetical protein EYF80_055715 [Liparis tanakae]|uniref:Secreted protein n=1 Tax=Liparis tanakae TaxID=230148 RepID=A0A4Z2F0V9_9TELE|nr:hypothetical protein EYF80_055715 [Liparis tanakae]